MIKLTLPLKNADIIIVSEPLENLELMKMYLVTSEEK